MPKYQPSKSLNFPQRTWPSRHMEHSPKWCSVDLRDGNQALITPMTPAQKLKFFKMLTKTGFREIEISFPSASEADYRFTRELIQGDHIPDGTKIQVLTQAREHLINKTFAALQDAPDVIVHLYNSTSPAQREIVFKKTTTEIIAIAVEGAKMIRDLSSRHHGNVTLEYSPESFSQTEPQFACDICNAVIDTWNPQGNDQIIINLPATVEITSPNIYADMVEYVSSRLLHRDKVITSIHTHNDRGCAVAAAELGMLAGAQRVEGTLFGNGERTGNADLVTLALNLYAQGIATGLDFSDLDSINTLYSECTNMQVGPRHPYAGSLVFTAFSGSHQDAISKGLAEYSHSNGTWRVPYLPIDPKDLGRTYEDIIRINSQSGKGGAAWILQQMHGFHIPKSMQREVGAVVQKVTDANGKELSNTEILQVFTDAFVNNGFPMSITNVTREQTGELNSHEHPVTVTAAMYHGTTRTPIKGSGNGLLDALIHALSEGGTPCNICSYHEHSLGEGSEAQAAAYIEIEQYGERRFGVGVDTDIAEATVKALVSALNRVQV